MAQTVSFIALCLVVLALMPLVYVLASASAGRARELMQLYRLGRARSLLRKLARRHSPTQVSEQPARRINRTALVEVLADLAAVGRR